MESLQGRVTFITGANSGIGQAAAPAFAKEGARLALAARRANELKAVAAECRAAGAEVIAMPTDVTDRAAVDRIVGATVERWGRLDILIASAGINFTRRRLDQASVEDYTRLFNINI